jgi:hypothetical protein
MNFRSSWVQTAVLTQIWLKRVRLYRDKLANPSQPKKQSQSDQDVSVFDLAGTVSRLIDSFCAKSVIKKWKRF